LKNFDEKCAKSKEMTTESKNYITGAVQHNLSFNQPFLLVITKAESAFLWDLDGGFCIKKTSGILLLVSGFLSIGFGLIYWFSNYAILEA
jgi:adenosylmethionine-8-amino-7-oxononanoate aminotransferase